MEEIDLPFADLIIPGIWIGDLKSMSYINSSFCHDKWAVVSLIDVDPSHLERHIIIPIEDRSDIDITSCLAQITTFIHNAIKDGFNVLIHCHSGLSRSVAIVCSYLMCYHKMSAIESILFVKSKRKDAGPNAGFQKQLMMYFI